jgi:O-antigen/teichoic acid export membrane protein
MHKRQILINAIMSVVQIVVISVSLFIVYKFLLATIGIEQFGIWSLVLATTSVTNIANFGLSGSVTKFVAKYAARNEYKNVYRVIQTTLISVALFMGIALLIGYPVIKWVLGLVIPSESFHLALSILPYALFALWITVITAIFQSGLDGLQRIDLRSSILMGGAVFHLILCFLLVPAYGLLGLAYAKVIQNILVSFSSWIIFKKHIPLLPNIPRKWDINIFKEIFKYGMNFQIISIMQMLYDPLTKLLLSRFGGLSMVGFYEMASRLVLQIRSIIVSANQVLVPSVAELNEKIPKKIKHIYLISYRLLFYLSLPIFSLIIISLPLISEVWIGHYERSFVIFGILLTVGWLFNLFSVPSYFVYLGTGELSWNVISHISIAILNTGIGFLLGYFYDGTGVVVAWVISLILGSSMINISYHIKNKIPLYELLPKESIKILIFCSTGIFLGFLGQLIFNSIVNPLLLNILIIVLFLTIILILVYFHPMRRKLVGWVKNDLINKYKKEKVRH